MVTLQMYAYVLVQRFFFHAYDFSYITLSDYRQCSFQNSFALLKWFITHKKSNYALRLL